MPAVLAPTGMATLAPPTDGAGVSDSVGCFLAPREPTSGLKTMVGLRFSAVTVRMYASGTRHHGERPTTRTKYTSGHKSQAKAKEWSAVVQRRRMHHSSTGKFYLALIVSTNPQACPPPHPPPITPRNRTWILPKQVLHDPPPLGHEAYQRTPCRVVFRVRPQVGSEVGDAGAHNRNYTGERGRKGSTKGETKAKGRHNQHSHTSYTQAINVRPPIQKERTAEKCRPNSNIT